MINVKSQLALLTSGGLGYSAKENSL